MESLLYRVLLYRLHHSMTCIHQIVHDTPIAYYQVYMNCTKTFSPETITVSTFTKLRFCRLNMQTQKLMCSLASYVVESSVCIVLHVADGAVFYCFFLRLRRRQIPLCVQ